MQNTWTKLLLVFGLAAPLISASVILTAELNSPTTTVTIDAPKFTTFITLTSATPDVAQPSEDPDIIITAELDAAIMPVSIDSLPSTTVDSTSSAEATLTDSPSGIQSTFNPIPTTRATLTIISDYQVPTPTPGSIAILNGIPTLVLNNTIQQNTTFLANADTEANADAGPPWPTAILPYQPWNTSYEGPIHDGDWQKYLQIWDPIWWSLHLDSLRQTACMCSDDDFLTNIDAQLASYMNFEFYSHESGAIYRLDWICGPAPSVMNLKQRVTGYKGLTEHCWQAAGGEYAGDHRAEDMKGYYCDQEEEFCVEPWRAEKRSFIFHGHKRNYDRNGVHTWSEIQPVVRDVCEPICRDAFKMGYNDFGQHNPNFITTFYPAKPIEWDVRDFYVPKPIHGDVAED